MTDKLPLTVLAQLDDVTVFQTAAYQMAGLEQADIKHRELEKPQQMLQTEQASYGELNLGLHVDDNPTQVLDNRMRLLATINHHLRTQQRAPISRLCWVNQVHGKQIHDVDADPLSMRPADADAMVSQQDGLGLAIMTADCVPIVLYQPASGQIAAIHAGWQGLACGIISTTIKRFTESGEIKAWIGVCISQENYEVDKQVRDKLLAGCIEYQSLLAQDMSNTDRFDQLYAVDSDVHSSTNTDSHTDKIKLDLPKLAADQLSAAGVILANETSINCSYSDPRYYSYRRQTHLQQPATGRMALIIVRA
ncbi:peptidoglycan editing factor PgeF [Psychrobacter sp. ENNN9_III]|uniref:peptidoglycan editing factor PgeF n=1 Tax=Psychrobacter sp. ENNN9_III TaxID=1254334 RepID=UPI00071E95D3|nr:peptidoglycan editing factor PgeF [Psychrobacter sp. ENNN9_III]